MDTLKISNHPVTLVDQVEERLLEYFHENHFCPGSTLPSEQQLAASLGVARSVLREAISRMKMVGMIETRTRRGMVITEPSILGSIKRGLIPSMLSDQTMFDVLGFRIALEMGICSDIFYNITPKDVQDLEDIVRIGEASENNEYTIISEFAFHSKLYEIAGNKTITEFQHIIREVMVYIKRKFNEYFYDIAVEIGKKSKHVTHKDLLEYIRKGDEDGYRKALEKHFEIYKIFLRNRQKAAKEPGNGNGRDGAY